MVITTDLPEFPIKDFMIIYFYICSKKNQGGNCQNHIYYQTVLKAYFQVVRDNSSMISLFQINILSLACCRYPKNIFFMI